MECEGGRKGKESAAVRTGPEPSAPISSSSVASPESLQQFGNLVTSSLITASSPQAAPDTTLNQPMCLNNNQSDPRKEWGKLM